MKLLMVGLSEREAAALDILVGMAMKGWQTERCGLRPGALLPLADLYVLDLAGAGLAQWSVGAEARLLQMLHGRPAVLIHPGRETSWSLSHAAGAQQQALVWLAKPYPSEAMRDALKKATHPVHQRASAVPLATAPRTSGPVRATAPIRPIFVARAAADDTLASPDVYAAPAPGPALAPADLSALYPTFPQLREHAVLNRIIEAGASAQAHELRLNLQVGLVLHPQRGWAALNAPRPALERLCRQAGLAGTMAVRPLSPEQAEEWVDRLGAPRESLDAFLWSLASTVLGPAPLQVVGDAHLRLRGFPDYTRLSGIPDFFVQLAAICVRLPQSLSALQAAFPAQDPQDIGRFALLSTLSGMGQLSLPVAPADGALPRRAHRPTPIRVRKPAMPVKRGFLQAILSRLF